MVKLVEHHSKSLLRTAGIAVPKGGPVATPGEARAMAVGIGGPVVVKAQVWTTSRAAQGLIRFADTPDAAAEAAADLLTKTAALHGSHVLVEEKIPFDREFYVGLIVDDHSRSPLLIFSSVGGSGIEQIALEHPDRVVRHPVDVLAGLREFEARDICLRAGIDGKLMLALAQTMLQFYAAARVHEARTAEINPLVVTQSGTLMALDARLTIDDYAVFRHPDLGIEMAREFDHPPTALERSAWEIEKGDYRGTFFFTQMETDFKRDERVIGFHGNGGGGAMISMDALLRRGFRIANFVDTSGNPPASKVYRAARLILMQRGIDGYFMGGSGVASQEQYHSARGLVKAFIDAPLTVPAVIRIGGNGEAQAISILERANGSFPARVEGYGRDTTTDACVDRLHALISDAPPTSDLASPTPPPDPAEPYRFETITGGTITLDHALCRTCESKVCVQTCDPKILKLEGDVPVLAITRDEAKRGGCTECLACEVECYFLGKRGGRIVLPIPGLEA